MLNRNDFVNMLKDELYIDNLPSHLVEWETKCAVHHADVIMTDSGIIDGPAGKVHFDGIPTSFERGRMLCYSYQLCQRAVLGR